MWTPIYLNGSWLVWIKKQKETCLNQFVLRAQKYDPRFNNQHKLGGGEPIMTFDNEHMNLHFDNEVDIHFNYENHEENGYGYDLETLIILH
jgi:hypothetical protein